jgi:hypothetical protein
MRSGPLRWALSTCIIFVGSACSDARTGTHDVWSRDCGHGASITLKVAYLPGSIETGDATGWGLNYRDGAEHQLWLYNNGLPVDGNTIMKSAA